MVLILRNELAIAQQRHQQLAMGFVQEDLLQNEQTAKLLLWVRQVLVHYFYGTCVTILSSRDSSSNIALNQFVNYIVLSMRSSCIH